MKQVHGLKNILFFFLLLFSINSFGQYDKNDTLRADVIRFFNKSEGFERSNNDFTLFIEDIITKEAYTNQKNGVFTIITFNSSTYFHLILFENGEYEMLNMYNYANVIDKLTNYFINNNNYSKQEVLNYFEAVNKIKRRNNKIGHTIRMEEEIIR